MKSTGALWAAILTLALNLLAGDVGATGGAEDFGTWLAGLRADALSAGISPATLETALELVDEPLPRVVELDRRQPERTLSLEEYVATRIDQALITDGRRMMRRYPTWLTRVERRYSVQRRFLVALWGIETGYGEFPGSFPVLQSLASLAYDGRRGDYFRRELLNTLHILDDGQIPPGQMKGSWAGAMGQCQFMPSSYRRFAVDADRDGRIDIWNSVPDVLASTANYLARLEWRDDQTWGRAVTLPADFDHSLAGLEHRLPLSEWQRLGIRRSNGGALPKRRMSASLILPDGPGGPAYLVYDNFRKLLAWNRSISFAVAVGTLSDRIARTGR